LAKRGHILRVIVLPSECVGRSHAFCIVMGGLAVMVGVDRLETEIAPLAEQHGLSVYDVEVVPYGRATLRVYVERAGQPGVTVGNLEAFARVLIPYLNLKALFPREGHVEVSSPGMNRRLRRPAHFTAAVGERVGVTAVAGATGKTSVTAKLLSVTDEGIHLESDVLPFVPFADIVRARLDPDIRI